MKLVGAGLLFATILASATVVLAQSAPPATPTPDINATSTPRPAPEMTVRPAPKIGPVLVDGKATLIVVFDPSNVKTVSASQTQAPPGSYFFAQPGTMCIGAIKVMGSSPTVLPNGAITSNGPFTFTRVGSPVGCAVSISSSAGGAPATVVF